MKSCNIPRKQMHCNIPRKQMMKQITTNYMYKGDNSLETSNPKSTIFNLNT